MRAVRCLAGDVMTPDDAQSARAITVLLAALAVVRVAAWKRGRR